MGSSEAKERIGELEERSLETAKTKQVNEN